jgi:hypothetical protein
VFGRDKEQQDLVEVRASCTKAIRMGFSYWFGICIHIYPKIGVQFCQDSECQLQNFAIQLGKKANFFLIHNALVVYF